MQVSATKFGKIVAKAWADDEFARRLKADPISVLTEEGIEVPKGTELNVLFDTPELVHLVIPGKPTTKEISVEDLNKLTWAYESNSGPSGGSRTLCVSKQ